MKVKRYNKKSDYTYTLGTYPTLELLQFKPELVIKVLLNSEGIKSDGISEIQQICADKNILCEVDDRTIQKLGYKENTYAVGVFKKFKSGLSHANHVVLVNPRNMGNIGTIVRTMVGFGVEDLAIIRPAADIFDPKVVRSAMGALFNLRFQYFDTIDDYLVKFSSDSTETKRNFYPLMLDGAKSIKEVTFENPWGLVFGNEGAGLPADYQKIGQTVFIPHSNKIDSLNLSTAASIALWSATSN